MIELRKITPENYQECLSLKVAAGQEKFVATNLKSLAQAWVYYESAIPFAIYNDETMVGFLMLSYYSVEHTYSIWRLMIDEKFQNKGYGKKALELAIDYIKKDERCKVIYIEYVPGNESAEHIYNQFGFTPTGEIDDGEIVMSLKI